LTSPQVEGEAPGAQHARGFAGDTEISVNTVRKWRGRFAACGPAGLREVRGWLTRRDTPDFWQRAADVCALYLEPPEGAVVQSIDEKTR
jgi:hypothetical protein